MAGTDRYNPVFAAVRITAISVPVWAPVRKIPAVPADTVWNSLPWNILYPLVIMLFNPKHHLTQKWMNTIENGLVVALPEALSTCLLTATYIVWWAIRYIWQHIFHSSTFSLKRYRNWRKWNENLRERTNNVLPRNINIPPTAALRSCVMVHNLISSWHVSLFCFCFDFVFLTNESTQYLTCIYHFDTTNFHELKSSSYFLAIAKSHNVCITSNRYIRDLRSTQIP